MKMFNAVMIGRRSLVLAVVSCSLIVGGAFGHQKADASDPDLTTKLNNGGFWKNLSDKGKTMFIVGLFDGQRDEVYECLALLGASKTSDSIVDKFNKYAALTVSYGEAVLRIDNFYKDPENLMIPIPTAWRFVVRIIRGDDPAEIQAGIVAERKWILKVAESNPPLSSARH
jgi:hypothetical protein